MTVRSRSLACTNRGNPSMPGHGEVCEVLPKHCKKSTRAGVQGMLAKPSY